MQQTNGFPAVADWAKIRNPAQGGTMMVFSKPVNIIAVCVAFLFVGAILFGAL